MKPQFTSRVQGPDGKVYLVSTVHHRKGEWAERWETAVFEGFGWMTLGRMQRYTVWAFDPEMAHTQYFDTVALVTGREVRHWLMSPESIKETRRSAIEVFKQPPRI